MYRISTNYCLNQLRNHAGRRAKLEQHKHELPEGAPAQMGALDEARVIALLSTSDDETRACVMHTFFDGCTRQEVADLVGLSVPTVRKRIEEFLDRARSEMGVSAENASVIIGILVCLPSLWSA